MNSRSKRARDELAYLLQNRRRIIVDMTLRLAKVGWFDAINKRSKNSRFSIRFPSEENCYKNNSLKFKKYWFYASFQDTFEEETGEMWLTSIQEDESINNFKAQLSQL